ncbi:MAG: uroporphyrinogen decarboxylase/cobalamine-independent methonine synthase family protein [Anaerolineae bacterium]
MPVELPAGVRAVLCDPTLLETDAAWRRRFLDLFNGPPPEKPLGLFGVNGSAEVSLYADPAAWMTAALTNLASRAVGLYDKEVYRPLLIDAWPYGVHFIDKLFDADVFELDGERNNWQAHYLPEEVGGLKMPDLEHHPAWQFAREIARAYLEADVPLVSFAAPVLSSPLNIALNLYGQAFLLALLEEPAAARHDLRVITDVITTLHRWYRANIPADRLQMVAAGGRFQPAGHGQLCGCSCHLVSGEQYAEFIAPLDRKVLAQHPRGGMIHTCGRHTQHIPAWRVMPELRALQMNDRAAEDLPLYLAEMRADQAFYVNPCEGMPLARILELGRGRRVVIVADSIQL